MVCTGVMTDAKNKGGGALQNPESTIVQAASSEPARSLLPEVPAGFQGAACPRLAELPSTRLLITVHRLGTSYVAALLLQAK